MFCRHVECWRDDPLGRMIQFSKKFSIETPWRRPKCQHIVCQHIVYIIFMKIEFWLLKFMFNTGASSCPLTAVTVTRYKAIWLQWHFFDVAIDLPHSIKHVWIQYRAFWLQWHFSPCPKGVTVSGQVCTDCTTIEHGSGGVSGDLRNEGSHCLKNYRPWRRPL